MASLIRANKIPQISNAIMTSKAIGMVLMDNSLETLAKSDQISNKEACERSSNPAHMKSLLTISTIPKSKFIEATPNGTVILNDLTQFGILEDVSSTHVRLKPNTELEEDIIRKVAKDDFDKIWAILQ